MANHLLKINTPPDSTISLKGIMATMEWNALFGTACSDAFHKAQCFVDSEVIRLSDPHVPFRDGTLKGSALLHTVMGQGEPTYQTPYAARLYFNPQFNFVGAPQRGGLWFEVMKADHAKSILNGAQSFFVSI